MVASGISHSSCPSTLNKMADNTLNREDPKVAANIALDASKADEAEHNMSILEAFRQNKKAVLWSMALSFALVMEGYDLVVLKSFYGHPNFLRRFGVPADTEIGYVIPAAWQSGLSNGAAAGGILGLLLNGWAVDRFGPKKVMFAALVALTGIIFIMVFANSLTMLCVAQVLAGFPWGIFQTLSTAYASEVCPIHLRGYLTSYINLCWGAGILLATGIVSATRKMSSDWGWRIPFCMQWAWIPPLLIIAILCPQSPWWLVRHGRLEEAEQSLRKLTNSETTSDDDRRNTVMMMVHTTELERQASTGTSYIDCFRGVDRRRTEIVMVTFAIQILSGQSIVGQGLQFLQRAGISTDLSFTLNLVLQSMFMVGTIVSWGLLTFFGRRTLYTTGLAFMSFMLWIIGGMGFLSSQSARVAVGCILIGVNFVYNCTLGPVCYTIISETSSTRLRNKSVALARVAYQCMSITGGIIVPKMLSPTDWNLGAKGAFIFAATGALCTVWCILRLPETKHRSYSELDVLFERRVPAWRFKSTKVDPFDLARTESHHAAGVEIKEDIGRTEKA